MYFFDYKINMYIFYWFYYVLVFYYELLKSFLGNSWSINNKLIEERMIKEKIEFIILFF